MESDELQVVINHMKILKPNLVCLSQFWEIALSMLFYTGQSSRSSYAKVSERMSL
jgi:hypothetical protein